MFNTRYLDRYYNTFLYRNLRDNKFFKKQSAPDKNYLNFTNSKSLKCCVIVEIYIGHCIQTI